MANSPATAFIYSIAAADDKLVWHRHNGAGNGGGLDTWQGPLDVGIGWDGLSHVLPAGGDRMYAVLGDGRLRWFAHKGFNDGQGLDSPNSWDGPNEVGHGWDGQAHVFSAGEGIIYSIADDGKLMWHRHNGWLTGAGLETPGSWDGPNEVGHGWDGQAHVFSAGEGIIYSIADDGKLMWHRHNGWLTGAGLETPGSWDGPNEVGHGWDGQAHVFSLLPVKPEPIR